MNLRGQCLVLSLSLLLSSCGMGGSGYDARFLEKYLLDGERALQESDGERSERMYRLCLAHAEKLGAGDWRLALAEGRLGKVLILNHKDAEAKSLLTSAVVHFRAAQAPGPESASLFAKERGEADSLLGLLLLGEGDANGARPYLEEASALLKPFWPASKDQSVRDTISGIGYARALYGIARLKEKAGDENAAVESYELALKVIDEERVPVSLREDIASDYIKFLKSKGKNDKASAVLQKQDAYARFNPGGLKAIARDAWHELFNRAHDAAKDGQYEKADQLYESANQKTRVYAKDGDDALKTLCDWSMVKQKLGDSAGADRLIKESEAMAIRMGGNQSVYCDNVLQAKDRLLRLQGKFDQVEAVLQQQLALRVAMRGKDNFHVGEAHQHLAECHFHMKKWAEGEADMRRAIAIFLQDRERNYKDLKDAYDKLIPVLEQEEKLDDLRQFRFDRAALMKDKIKWESENSEQ